MSEAVEGETIDASLEARWSVEKLDVVDVTFRGWGKHNIILSHDRPDQGRSVLYRWRRQRGKSKGKLAQIVDMPRYLIWDLDLLFIL